jgi:hypothetical protein
VFWTRLRIWGAAYSPLFASELLALRGKQGGVGRLRPKRGRGRARKERGRSLGGGWPGQTGQLLRPVWWLVGQAVRGADTQRRRTRALTSILREWECPMWR